MLWRKFSLPRCLCGTFCRGADVVARTGIAPGGLAGHQDEHPGARGGREGRTEPRAPQCPQADSVSPGLRESFQGCWQGEKADDVGGSQVSAWRPHHPPECTQDPTCSPDPPIPSRSLPMFLWGPHFCHDCNPGRSVNFNKPILQSHPAVVPRVPE